MQSTVTVSAVDTRMANPSDLLQRYGGSRIAVARRLLDSAAAIAEGRDGLRYPPWRQSYSLRLPGTGHTQIGLFSKPVESVSIALIDDDDLDPSTFTLITDDLGIPDRLERDQGWRRRFTRASGLSRTEDSESEVDNWQSTTVAGWVMPGQVGPWVASSAYVAEIATTSYDDPSTGRPYDRGSWVRSSDPRIILRFECMASGTTGSAEPSEFSDSSIQPGVTIADGSVTWTSRAAFELPADLEEQSLRLALWIFRFEANECDREDVGKSAEGIPGSIARTFEAYR